jgi:hypothetical protein
MNPDVISGVPDHGDVCIEILICEVLLESAQESRATNAAGEGCDLHGRILAASMHRR